MSFDLPEPTPADCLGVLHPQAVAGLKLFNLGKFWHAHEALETAWLEETGETRHLYRGVLQLAVTYFHVTRRNYPGVIKVYQRSQRWLDPFPDICRGLHLGQLRQDAAVVLAEVQRLGPNRLAEFDLALLKPVVWDEPDETI